MGKTSIVLNIVEHVGVVEETGCEVFLGNVSTAGGAEYAFALMRG